MVPRYERADANSLQAAELSLSGHYAEFGVYRGETFAHVVNRGAELMPWMLFYVILYLLKRNMMIEVHQNSPSGYKVVDFLRIAAEEVVFRPE